MQPKNVFDAERKALQLEQRAQFAERMGARARGPMAAEFRQKARDLRREASELWHTRPGFIVRPDLRAMAIVRGPSVSDGEMRQLLGSDRRTSL